MSSMLIGDKTLTPIQTPSADRAGEQARSNEGKQAGNATESQADRLALSSAGAEKEERPLSTRIANPQQAMVSLLELKGRIQQSPEQALSAHAGIRTEATHALTQALNGAA